MGYIRFLLLLSLAACSSVPSRPEHYREDKEFSSKAKKPMYINLHPKVCFDEGHNNLAVEYGFYDSVLGLVESDGYEIIRLKKRFTEDVLKGCKIIYSSTVSGHPDADDENASESAFDVEEVESIVKWVREGGSLLLMSDHGKQARAASKLLKEFGIHGSVESVKDSKNMLPVFSDPGIITVAGKELNENSPIILGRNFSERVKRVHYFRGQGLRGPKNSDLFLRTTASATIGNVPRNQFPAVGVAVKYGKGRVVVIGDGTVFAAKIDERNNEPTGINRKDNDNGQLALNVFRWLSRALN